MCPDAKSSNGNVAIENTCSALPRAYRLIITPRASAYVPPAAALCAPGAVRSASSAVSDSSRRGRRASAVVSRRCAAAFARSAAAGALRAASGRARWTTSLKKVWSFDHHWSIAGGSLAMLTISSCIRSTHERQSAIAPALEWSSSIPVFISWSTPHCCASLSLAPLVTSVETTTSAKASSRDDPAAAAPSTHGLGSRSQSTSRSAQSTSKPPRKTP